MSGASAGIRLPSGLAVGSSRRDPEWRRQGSDGVGGHCRSRDSADRSAGLADVVVGSKVRVEQSEFDPRSLLAAW